MPAIYSESGYSSDVRLRLQIDDQLVRIAQIGDGFLILRDPCDHVPAKTPASVIICVDDDETHYPVMLTEGIVRNVNFVEYVDLAQCQLVSAKGEIYTRVGPVRVERAGG